MRIAPLMIGAGVAALILTGCSKSATVTEKSATEKTTVTETVTASVSAPDKSESATTAPNLPQPPTGATALNSSDSDGVQHARYSVTGQTPKQVVDHYAGLWKDQGYTISESSGGGGGEDGGSGANATGSKGGTFVGVDAGGRNGEATYFDVCVGSDQDAVTHCLKHRG